MTTNEKVARRKLSLLELAKELNNVSKACKLIGYSRQQFYEIRRSYQTYGAEGLLDKLPSCKGAHPNRVAPEIEQAILDYSLTRLTHGPQRVAQELGQCRWSAWRVATAQLALQTRPLVAPRENTPGADH